MRYHPGGFGRHATLGVGSMGGTRGNVVSRIVAAGIWMVFIAVAVAPDPWSLAACGPACGNQTAPRCLGKSDYLDGIAKTNGQCFGVDAQAPGTNCPAFPAFASCYTASGKTIDQAPNSTWADAPVNDDGTRCCYLNTNYDCP